jgi:hypothetical protein
VQLASLRQVMTRLWYVTIAGILVTAGLAIAASQLVPAQYEAQSRILLLQKTFTGDAEGANPFVGISGLTPFTDVVARSMADTAAAETLRSQGVTSTYTVVRDLTTNGPVLLVTVTGETSAAAVSDLDSVVSTAGPVLSQLQAAADVAAEAQVTAQIITQDTSSAVVRKSQIRAMVVATAVGAFLTVLTAIFLDRRRIRRRGAGELDEPPEQVSSAKRDADHDVAAVDRAGPGPAGTFRDRPPSHTANPARRPAQVDQPVEARAGELAGRRSGARRPS